MHESIVAYNLFSYSLVAEFTNRLLIELQLADKWIFSQLQTVKENS